MGVVPADTEVDGLFRIEQRGRPGHVAGHSARINRDRVVGRLPSKKA